MEFDNKEIILETYVKSREIKKAKDFAKAHNLQNNLIVKLKEEKLFGEAGIVCEENGDLRNASMCYKKMPESQKYSTRYEDLLSEENIINTKFAFRLYMNSNSYTDGSSMLH